MPKQPEDPYLINEPRTEPHTLGRSSSSVRARDDDERPPLRRLMFWGVVALVLVAGLVLYFLYADAVVPILGTDR